MTNNQWDESSLRHPWERPILLASLVVNFGLIAISIWLFTSGSNWLKSHPVLRDYAKHFQAVAIAFVGAPPAMVFIRNVRRATVRGNSIPLAREQVPEIYAILENHCRRLGIDRVPELYLTEKAVPAPGLAFSVYGHNCIGLSARYIDKEPVKSTDVISFILGRELGRLRLGHTHWGRELLLAYVINTPYLRNPLYQVQALSQDRYGAYLETNAIQGLAIMACGRRLLGRIDLNHTLHALRNYGGFWVWISNLSKTNPHLAIRLRALINAGLVNSEMPVQAVAENDKGKEKHKKKKHKAAANGSSLVTHN